MIMAKIRLFAEKETKPNKANPASPLASPGLVRRRLLHYAEINFNPPGKG